MEGSAHVGGVTWGLVGSACVVRGATFARATAACDPSASPRPVMRIWTKKIDEKSCGRHQHVRNMRVSLCASLLHALMAHGPFSFLKDCPYLSCGGRGELHWLSRVPFSVGQLVAGHPVAPVGSFPPDTYIRPPRRSPNLFRKGERAGQGICASSYKGCCASASATWPRFRSFLSSQGR